MAGEKVLHQLEDVAAPLAKRGHADVDAAQAIEQIGAERPLLHEIRESAIGRGDDPDVDPVHTVAADAFDGKILNRAQQLRLRGQRQIRDFIEEQRAAIRRFELPRLPRTPVAVRSSIPNSSASSSVSTSAAQLMAMNGPALPATELVDLPGDEFLADAALAPKRPTVVARLCGSAWICQ